jgi:hypothetical protein
VFTAEKHDQRSEGTTNDSVLMDAQEEGTATASHFTGHQKVTHVASHEGNGTAPHFAKDYDQQEAKGLKGRYEKHAAIGSNTGSTTHRTIGECTDSPWRGTAPHHQNCQQQVQTITFRPDNGAAQNFARTDSTRKPEALQGPHRQAAEEENRSLSPSTVDTHQVTDVDSQTAVGCFSRRYANTTLPTTIDEELMSQEEHGKIAEETKWEEGPACLQLPESKWPIKQDIVNRRDRAVGQRKDKNTKTRTRKWNAQKHQVCVREA